MSYPAPTLPSILAEKKWFGFDLDDTLHEFRKASMQASKGVFESIHYRYGIEIETLKSSYGEILRCTTASAFTDGRTSTEYRRDRFTRLLQVHGINEVDQEDQYIAHLLNLYQSSLQFNLAIKAGALSFLRALKQRGKNIIVITEGPADAQERTVQELGLKHYIDVLVTTNEMGRSKVDGLFGAVLKKYGIHSDEIVYFGDNAVRDIKESQEEGILAVLYDEKQQNQLTDMGTLSINSWGTLKDMLEREG